MVTDVLSIKNLKEEYLPRVRKVVAKDRPEVKLAPMRYCILSGQLHEITRTMEGDIEPIEVKKGLGDFLVQGIAFLDSMIVGCELEYNWPEGVINRSVFEQEVKFAYRNFVKYATQLAKGITHSPNFDPDAYVWPKKNFDLGEFHRELYTLATLVSKQFYNQDYVNLDELARFGLENFELRGGKKAEIQKKEGVI